MRESLKVHPFGPVLLAAFCVAMWRWFRDRSDGFDLATLSKLERGVAVGIGALWLAWALRRAVRELRTSANG